MNTTYTGLDGLGHLQFLLEAEYGFQRQVDFRCDSASDSVTFMPIGDPYLIDESWPDGTAIPDQAAIDAMKAKHATAWADKNASALIDAVRVEAQRRITELLPEWMQRNLTAQATILAEKGRDNWTAAEHSAWADGEARWGQVAAHRARSNEIEAMTPIPTNFREIW